MPCPLAFNVNAMLPTGPFTAVPAHRLKLSTAIARVGLLGF